MLLSNFHTHSNFCDGQQEPEKYVLEAISKGFKVLGFSSHAPIPFENDWNMKKERINGYLEEIKRLKVRYEKQIQIYTGLEIDYFENVDEHTYSGYSVDYTIGAVHFFHDTTNGLIYNIDGNDVDFRKTLNEYFNGDIQNFVKTYYRNIVEMVTKQKPDILGHFDVIKKNNANEKYFSEDDIWYKAIVNGALQEIAAAGIIMEVNTGGIIRGYIKEPYPSEWIIKECRKLDIPMIINSDAHSPENIDGFFDEAAIIMKNAGYFEQKIIIDGCWKIVKI